MTDIIDQIDALVDEQMAGGEPIGGFDYNDPYFPKCPHCPRDWHGIRITERVEYMRYWSGWDEEYRADADDSPVICEGSTFIGPARPPADWAPSGLRPSLGVPVLVRDYQLPPAPVVDLESWGFHRIGYMSERGPERVRVPTPRRWWRASIIPGMSVSVAPEQNTITMIYATDHSLIAYSMCAEDVQTSDGVIDIRAVSPPNIGGTWAPLTPLGVERHPDDMPGPTVVVGGVIDAGVAEAFRALLSSGESTGPTYRQLLGLPVLDAPPGPWPSPRRHAQRGQSRWRR
ncbi:Uncharacterised protein [Mycobacteroides abscessus subsp. abscessus]|uniref:hypothetical protein n=1 Tax=Mycobacteroides abscessus TaxID=36809 RepID=UPI000926835E|nr:hypothetical protein [Mycobacteroides abscessus]SIC55762.1 Uncharacterised protein [Mycobacteroides abscessus subsp. abscessus]SKU58156.1 Uncharacterised protein [Mycobacteroides abscessus subsp. abscessus]